MNFLLLINDKQQIFFLIRICVTGRLERVGFITVFYGQKKKGNSQKNTLQTEIKLRKQNADIRPVTNVYKPKTTTYFV